MDKPFPAGFTMRPAVMVDASALADLIAARERHDYPAGLDYQPDYTAEDIHGEWQSMDLVADTRVVKALSGQLVGYLGNAMGFVDVERTQPYFHIQSFSGVHPQYVGQGIGTALLHFADDWVAKQHPQPDIRVIAWINPRSERAHRLLTREGFQPDHHSVVEMKVTLQQEPAPAQWPAGIDVRAFVPGKDDALVRSAIEEAFERPFTHWDQIYTNRADFDPTLWHLAWDGEQLAGVLIGVPNPAMGWIDQLGVRTAWRKRGIGEALLRHAIHEYYRRGLRTVALSVRANNEHGALRLYERAGMRVGSEIARYGKSALRDPSSL